MIPFKVIELISRGALFVVNHSAGKDSQAMLLILRDVGVPDDQIILVHADLGEIEWAGNTEHINKNSFGLPLIIARAKRTLLEMVEERGMWPSPQQRQCTSDLKRGPIEREIRRYLKNHPQFGNLVVNCMGMRAEESTARDKMLVFQRVERNCLEDRRLKSGKFIRGRDWYNWLPIHRMTKTEVLHKIRTAGQSPHWAYFAGMTRLSCCFCIMASQQDLRTAARLRPELFKTYTELEARIGHTLSMSRRPLIEIVGEAA